MERAFSSFLWFVFENYNKIVSKNYMIDPETQQAAAQGFTGCLSSVRFGLEVPLKAALNQNRARVTIQGSVAAAAHCAEGPGSAERKLSPGPSMGAGV